MIYELRIYTVLPGRLPALRRRFKDHTCRLFEKHGIRNIGYWTNVIGGSSDQLTYIVAYDDLAAREAAWAAFRADPEWQEAAAASEADGLIVHHIENRIMAATDFSPLN